MEHRGTVDYRGVDGQFPMAMDVQNVEAPRRSTEDRLSDIEYKTELILASQTRTEEMVKGFIESMSKNPMMASIAGMFGRRG